MRGLRTLCLVGVALMALTGLTPLGAHAQDVFYAASGGGGLGSPTGGSLYLMNQANGQVTLIGALIDASGASYGLSGLSFDPGSGTLFGATGNGSPTAPGSLVTVNPATGQVTLIGSHAIVGPMSDITFAPDGTLYGWQAAGAHQLHTINTATGVGTVVNPAAPNPGFGGGSLAASAAGTLFSTPDSNTNPPGGLYTVGTLNGLLTPVATLSGAPLISGAGGMVINASNFGSNGVLYGINTNGAGGGASITHLVSIDTATGAITDIGLNTDTLGAIVNNLDALAILQAAVPEPSTWALIGVGVGGFVYGLRRQRQKALNRRR